MQAARPLGLPRGAAAGKATRCLGQLALRLLQAPHNTRMNSPGGAAVFEGPPPPPPPRLVCAAMTPSSTLAHHEALLALGLHLCQPRPVLRLERLALALPRRRLLLRRLHRPLPRRHLLLQLVDGRLERLRARASPARRLRAATSHGVGTPPHSLAREGRARTSFSDAHALPLAAASAAAACLAATSACSAAARARASLRCFSSAPTAALHPDSSSCVRVRPAGTVPRWRRGPLRPDRGVHRRWGGGGVTCVVARARSFSRSLAWTPVSCGHAHNTSRPVGPMPGGKRLQGPLP